MGSCCSINGGADSATGGDALELHITPGAPCVTHPFYRELERGIEVTVIPVSRTGIACRLRYDPRFQRFILSKDTTSRQIQLSRLQRVMHTRGDLRRVENQAGMANDSNCCALLLKTQSCIGLRFESKTENRAFIEITEHLIADSKTEIES